jgi:hypothetical protein
MCFTIHPTHSEPLIAKKNIVCYKILQDDGLNKISPYYDEIYFKKGGSCEYVNKEIDDFSFSTNFETFERCINQGLHVYSSIKKANDEVDHLNESVYKCVIPKGTKYYYNPADNEYVSLKLKVYKSAFTVSLLNRILSVKLFK